MGSLLDELARREAAVRQRIEEIGERIAELNGLLEVEEDRLARLVITRETVEEILGEAAQVVEEPASRVRSVEPAGTAGAASRLGVVTVPRWRPGMERGALPQAYQDAVEILADAAGGMRAGQILAAMGLPDAAAKREGLRSKLKRLVERGWATEDGPGPFTLAQPVARHLGRHLGRDLGRDLGVKAVPAGEAAGRDGITSSLAG